MVVALRARKQLKRQEILRDVTIRDFSGGWNVVDSDLNLSSKFSKRLTNMQRSVDGGNEIRPGTKLFADCTAYLDEIVHITYFSNALIAVGQNGKLVSVDARGTIVLIWDADRASKLSGSPDGWSITFYASSTVFNGSLIICNGVNKPLRVDTSHNVEYLVDAATNSNAFMPVCRYVATQGRYLLMAGDPINVDFLYISSTDVAIFVGAPAPNDAVTIALGSRVTAGSDTIKGIGTFRTTVVVLFDEVIIPGTLGKFVNATSGGDITAFASIHAPDFKDAIENHGAVAHKTVQTIGEDMLFADNSGVTSIDRAVFTNNVKAERFSQLIDPELQADLDKINNITTLEDRVFSIYDSQFSNYMLFVPNSGTLEAITNTRCYVLKKNDPLKIEAWAPWEGWNFRSGCRSSGKRIFLTEGAEIYLMGELHNKAVRDLPTSTDDELPRDFMGAQEMWDDDTTFTDANGWTPVTNIADSGIPIYFEWLLPWADNDSRFQVKNSRYIAFDTEGNQRFTAQMFTDNNFRDRGDHGETWDADGLLFDDDLGWDVEALDPTLEMDFIGGEGPGYGEDEYGEYYGGGRATRSEQLHAWVSKYKIYRLRFFGYATGPLKFTAVTMAYTGGSIRR